MMITVILWFVDGALRAERGGGKGESDSPRPVTFDLISDPNNTTLRCKLAFALLRLIVDDQLRFLD